jgi:hypothetical protein
MCRSLVVRKESNDRRFRMFFGTSPRVCSRIWCLIDPYTMMPNGVKPANLLWALMFLKLYCAESVHYACTMHEDEGRKDVIDVL